MKELCGYHKCAHRHHSFIYTSLVTIYYPKQEHQVGIHARCTHVFTHGAISPTGMFWEVDPRRNTQGEQLMKPGTDS